MSNYILTSTHPQAFDTPQNAQMYSVEQTTFDACICAGQSFDSSLQLDCGVRTSMSAQDDDKDDDAAGDEDERHGDDE